MSLVNFTVDSRGCTPLASSLPLFPHGRSMRGSERRKQMKVGKKFHTPKGEGSIMTTVTVHCVVIIMQSVHTSICCGKNGKKKNLSKAGVLELPAEMGSRMKCQDVVVIKRRHISVQLHSVAPISPRPNASFTHVTNHSAPRFSWHLASKTSSKMTMSDRNCYIPTQLVSHPCPPAAGIKTWPSVGSSSASFCTSSLHTSRPGATSITQKAPIFYPFDPQRAKPISAFTFALQHTQLFGAKLIQKHLKLENMHFPQKMQCECLKLKSFCRII